MDLLILGGTGFLGRHLVEAALGDGHRPTLFNRGLHEPGLFPEVEKIEGERDGDLSALRGRRWDAVIDTCGYVPRVVGTSAWLLADAVEHYTFVSSISVYSDAIAPGADEEAPVRELPEPTVEEVTGETYGGLKALCERAAEETMAGRVLNVRPGLISGPHDPTDRFIYWPRRVAAGGEVLAPDHEERKVQYIDVRDLASWIVEMSEQRRTGTYNATGPDYELEMGRLLEECEAVGGAGAEPIWVSEDFLEERGVEPFTELPLWVPREHAALQAIDCGKAIEAGLTFRPLSETIEDVLDWDRATTAGRDPAAGLRPEREQELLRAWHGVTL
ncbi:MAG TPA: NAD-dependent epimerase/dehydratase family protein [Rubrobacter sp.]|nr:NAD-dependent epimerase/dehydratase family protein [Rubrobacter sp.]